MPINIKIINRSKNPLPAYATEGASGMDVRASLEKDISLAPFHRAAVPTGLYLEIPTGYEVQVRPRSGLALHHGVTCLNTPGTIDSDYRGEVKVILVNLSDSEFMIRDGERIAQLVVQKIERTVWEQTDDMDETTRGAGGFGHTGYN